MPTERGGSAISRAMLNVMAKVSFIGKDGNNTFHKFKYRSIDGAMKAMQPVFVECGIVLNVSVELVKLLERKDSVNAIIGLSVDMVSVEDGSVTHCRFLGMGEDKLDKAIAKAHADAYKQFLFKTFCIPVEGEPENERDDATTTAAVTTPAERGKAIKAMVTEVFSNPESGKVKDVATEMLSALKAEYDRMAGMVKFAKEVGDLGELALRENELATIYAKGTKIKNARSLAELEEIKNGRV